jgi:MFS family permease
MSSSPRPGEVVPRVTGTVAPRLSGWRSAPVVAVALAALASGFGQFGVVAALGSVASTFGHVTSGPSLADQAGLSGSALGIGLAVIRLSSLGGLPVTGLADRFGRRVMILGSLSVGLGLTVAAAASPGYWWFVAIFACGRPALSATNGLAQLVAAEQTSSSERAKAIALVAAAYGVGAGLTAIVHSLAASVLGFRGLLLLALVPLVGVVLLERALVEPDRFAIEAARAEHPLPVLGAVERPYRRRLAVVCTIALLLSVITGPANSFVFLYAENVAKLPGWATAAMVVGAGATGLLGLLLGRYLADRVGRRPAAALGMVATGLFGVVTYLGPHLALVGGYVLGVLSGATLAPAAGALVNELFPTSVRASVTGWWLASGVLGAAGGLALFGVLADVGNRFGNAAAEVFLPATLGAALFLALPETRGGELEAASPAGA